MPNMDIELRALSTKWAAVDKTLTADGAPADAKTVGDRLADTATQGDLTALGNTLRGEIADAIAEQQIDTTAIQTIAEAVFRDMFEDQLDALHPVGSIVVYSADEDRNPAEILGIGVWQKIEGRYLFGSDAAHEAGTTGGQESVLHSHGGTTGETTLTTDQMPAHTHGSISLVGTFNFGSNMTISTATASANLLSRTGICNPAKKTGITYSRPSSVAKNSAAQTGYNCVEVNASHEHASVGGGQGHAHEISAEEIETMPPYESVHVWKRVS